MMRRRLNSRPRALLAATLLPAALLCSAPFSHAEVPNNIEDIKRESRIFNDVLGAALRQQLRGDTRVTQMRTDYLPHQGVLISMTLNTPWLKYDSNGEPQFEFHGEISLPEIPAMVSNILQDLQLNASPYEPESLEELRALREEQRSLRSESRSKRSELRAQRRLLARSEGRQERQHVENEVETLEKELNLLEEQYEALSNEIEMHYDALRDAPEPPPAPQPANQSQPQLEPDEVFAQAICDYGQTLKSLRANEYLTLAVRRGQQSEYFVFRMDEVKRCTGSNGATRLLANATRYSS